MIYHVDDLPMENPNDETDGDASLIVVILITIFQMIRNITLIPNLKIVLILEKQIIAMIQRSGLHLK